MVEVPFQSVLGVSVRVVPTALDVIYEDEEVAETVKLLTTLSISATDSVTDLAVSSSVD
jgi:hypothetical protein